jgi:hypothetical protein
MFRSLRLWPALGASLALAAVTLIPAVASHDHAAAAGASSNRAAFHDEMRRLWEEHIVWTRMVIVSATDDLADASVATDRLLRNQDHLGDAIKPFYGDAAGEQLSTLLREHIVGAAALLTAAKAGDTAALEAASATWYANGDEIATFLSQANPRNWGLDEMKRMMRDHLDLTLAEAVARLQGRYDDDVAAYDQIHAQILHMADMLSAGIIDQFPSRFAR